MIDADFQALSSVGSDKSPLPRTFASATTIAPTTFLSFVSGTVQVGTITPPIEHGHQMIVLIFTDGSPGTMLTTGNIFSAIVPTQNLPTFMIWDPVSNKWYGAATNVT